MNSIDSPARKTFNSIGSHYEEAYGNIPEQLAALEWIIESAPAGARVLDIGSGTGRPTAKTLSEAGLDVVGIDVSEIMIDIARRQAPRANFLLQDIRSYSGDGIHWDVVCSFFALLQMSRDDINSSLRRMRDLLRPGGLMVVATVPADIEGLPIAWLGQEIMATSYDVEEFGNRILSTGFDILRIATGSFAINGESRREPQAFFYCRRPSPPMSP